MYIYMQKSSKQGLTCLPSQVLGQYFDDVMEFYMVYCDNINNTLIS